MCSQDAARSINNSHFYLEQSKIGITYPRPLWRPQPSTLSCLGPPNRLHRFFFFFSSQCQPPFQKLQNNQLVDCGRCNRRRRRNLRFCPETCRKTAYTSLVRSLLEYSSTVWDPHVQEEIDKIEGIQRRAARYIKRDYQSRNPGCVTAMLQELDLPLLQERRRQNRLTFLFKIIGRLPGIKAEKHLAPILNK